MMTGMKALLNVPAPAKVNLFLHVVGRRPDGYHLLQSVFLLLDLFDDLSFELTHNATIQREDHRCEESDAPLPVDDLCIRAAKLLQRTTGTHLGAYIHLTKRVPAQAGMGGGSSDAATCLLALNRLWRTGLNRQQLASLGAQLGADVPFFIFGRNAWVEGTGDELIALDIAPQRIAIVKPASGLPTASIFGDPLLKRDSVHATIQGFANIALDSRMLFGTNDLQPVAERHCQDIRRCIDWLSGHGLVGRMTGSGSAVFSLLGEHDFLPEVPAPWFGAVCSSLTEHPLKNWVSD